MQHVYIEESIVQKIKLQIIDLIKHHHVVLWYIIILNCYFDIQYDYKVKYHNITSRFCDYMETIFSPMLFLQTVASSLIICLVGLQIATANITTSIISKSIKYISYLIMALFQLLLFCIPGDALIYEVCG